MPWPTTSRHARGYGSSWDKLRLRILARDKHLCQPCKREGRITAATQVDHRRRKEDGGTDDEGNLQAICAPCHTDKTTRENGGRVKQAIGNDGWPVT
jgi:5-methylcytosine-specific restriction protein A